MFARIIVGILIGLAAGLIFSGRLSLEAKTLQALQGFIAVIAIAFIAASFMFGAVFGVMAIAELAGGYFAYAKLQNQRAE